MPSLDIVSCKLLGGTERQHERERIGAWAGEARVDEGRAPCWVTHSTFILLSSPSSPGALAARPRAPIAFRSEAGVVGKGLQSLPLANWRMTPQPPACVCGPLPPSQQRGHGRTNAAASSPAMAAAVVARRLCGRALPSCVCRRRTAPRACLMGSSVWALHRLQRIQQRLAPLRPPCTGSQAPAPLRRRRRCPCDRPASGGV